MSPKSITSHNYGVQMYAKEFAKNMQRNPSPLEERMIDFLDKHNFYYIFQKIFYITESDGYVSKFFIADFYFPNSKTILETDGQFHKKQTKYDAKRTELITTCYPDVKVIRWEWKDFEDSEKINMLLQQLQSDREQSIEATQRPKVERMKVEPFFFTYSQGIRKLYSSKIFDVFIRVLWKLMEFVEHNTGKIYMNSDRVSEVINSCKISKTSYYRAVKKLKEIGVLLGGDKGTYNIAGNMFWKGDRNGRNHFKNKMLNELICTE